jgi:hypothetical protein
MIIVPPTTQEANAHAARQVAAADRAGLISHAAAAAQANSVPALRVHVAGVSEKSVNHADRIAALEAKVAELTILVATLLEKS